MNNNRINDKTEIKNVSKKQILGNNSDSNTSKGIKSVPTKPKVEKNKKVNNTIVPKTLINRNNNVLNARFNI